MPFSNETVFITGFPGFLAERLVKHLAKLHAHFILLVQPSLLNRARSDVSRIATETGAPVENFMIVPGDITEDIAREIVERAARDGESLSKGAQQFVEWATGENVPASLMEQ